MANGVGSYRMALGARVYRKRGVTMGVWVDGGAAEAQDAPDGERCWIPAFAGKTGGSRLRGNDQERAGWIPAGAGTTKGAGPLPGSFAALRLVSG